MRERRSDLYRTVATEGETAHALPLRAVSGLHLEAMRRVCLVGSLTALALGLGLWGCSEQSCESTGTCRTSCSDESCAEGSRCVNDVCRPACESDATCRGNDSCERIQTDFGSVGSYCFGPTLSESPYLESQSDASDVSGCRKNSQCSSNPAQACVDGFCLNLCETHAQCGDVGSCTGDAQDVEGNAVHFCKADEFPHGAGQYGSRCLGGSTDCDQAAAFRCYGAGEGDSDGYCTAMGCDDDAGCPAGYACKHLLARGTPPCEAACGVAGEPTDADCAEPSEIGPGKPFACADFGTGLQLRLCVKRDFCSPCESDSDCRGLPDQLCARGPDGTKSCTRRCDGAGDECPWGTASECAVFDPELGQATCGHRFGSCHGTGASCEPCVDDRDCPGGVCAGSGYSGEQYCVNLQTTCACADGETFCEGGGCPLSPDGVELTCVPAAEGASPSVCTSGPISREDGAPRGCWSE